MTKTDRALTYKIARMIDAKLDERFKILASKKVDVAKPESKASMKAHIQHWGFTDVKITNISDQGKSGKYFVYNISFTYGGTTGTIDDVIKAIRADSGANLKYIGKGNLIKSVRVWSKSQKGTLVFHELLENKFASNRNRANNKEGAFNSQLAALG